MRGGGQRKRGSSHVGTRTWVPSVAPDYAVGGLRTAHAAIDLRRGQLVLLRRASADDELEEVEFIEQPPRVVVVDADRAPDLGRCPGVLDYRGERRYR